LLTEYMKKFVLPDTSIFLYFQSLDQLDLAEVLQCDAVELVIPPAVIEDLERQGWDHPRLSTRKRAENSLRTIRTWTEMNDGLVRPSVEVTLCYSPRPTTFQEHRLDANNRDDLIIASVLEYSQIHGVEAVMLLTDDVRRRLKAHRLNLQSVTLPPGTRLPPAEGALEDQVPGAQWEPTRQPRRGPQVELRFGNGSHMLEVRPKEEVWDTADMVAAQFAELRDQYQEPLRLREGKVMPGIDDREAASMLTNAMLYPQAEFERYRQEVQAFLGACEEWLQRRAEALSPTRRTVRLDLGLVNSGAAAAEGVVLTLALPKRLRWLETLSDDEMPRPPKPPRTHMEMMNEAISDLYDAIILPWSAGFEPVEMSRADSWLVEGQELRGLVDVCLQHRTVKLPHAHAVFIDAEAVSTFAISYVINERNTPEPMDGKLLVRVLQPPA
jgi:hypothetical protein